MCQQSQMASCFAGSSLRGQRHISSKGVRLPAGSSCPLYLCTLISPCAASCLCICKHMQCNVPERCWRLQTAKYAPAYACEPRLLLLSAKTVPGTCSMRQSGKDLNRKPRKASTGCEWADLLDDQRISHMHLLWGWLPANPSQSVRI